MNSKTSKKTIICAVCVALFVVIIIGGLLILKSQSSDRGLQAQLDLGNRYLSEINYEQAIACFEAAIEIDPKNVEAYKGLIDAYAKSGDNESALEAAQRAYEATGDEVFAEIIRSLSEDENEIEEDGETAIDNPETEEDTDENKPLLVKSERSDGVVYTFEYDEHGNMIRKDGSDGYWETWKYENDRMVRHETDGWYELFKYDDSGNKTYHETQNDWEKWDYDQNTLTGYDFSYGEISKYEDDGHNVTYYEYTDPDGKNHWNILEYDANNNLIFMEGSDDKWFKYTYEDNTLRSVSTNIRPLNLDQGQDSWIYYDSRGNKVYDNCGDGTYTNYYSDGAVLTYDNP